MVAEAIAARVQCRPAQKGNSKRLIYVKGSPRLISSSKDKRAERDLVSALMPYAPEVPLSGTCMLELSILQPIPRSWPLWKQKAARDTTLRPASRGTHDSCNVLKLVEDSIEAAGWVEDDTLFIEHRVSAYYSTDPGYRIVVRPLALLTPKGKRVDYDALMAQAEA